MKFKCEIIKMVLSMRNEDYLFKTYHYILAKYRREKGRCDSMNNEEYISEERNTISELIAGIDDLWILNQIRKFIVNMTKE